MSGPVAVIVTGLALAAAIALLAVLALVVTGIHAAERRKSLPHAPRSRAEVIARRVLGVHGPQEHQARRPSAEQRRYR
ncbi:MAG TPA: hypothetical protein VNF47_25645 [Streptosporangiaceae bacterium]|nr:hypothetical protein [Streptosporangiaceae bacterium]